VFTKTLSGNTNFTFSNVQLNKVITLIISGDYTLVTNFMEVFRETDITSIGTNVFQYNTEVTTFEGALRSCLALTTVDTAMFNTNTKVTTYAYCFYGNTAITSAVPELWDLVPEPTGTDCFYGCTSASNYADIPSDWK
jgi:hypothetical protein